MEQVRLFSSDILEFKWITRVYLTLWAWLWFLHHSLGNGQDANILAPSIDFTFPSTMAPQLQTTPPVAHDVNQPLLFPCWWKHRLGKPSSVAKVTMQWMSSWERTQDHREWRCSDGRQSWNRGYMGDMCSLIDFKCSSCGERHFGVGGDFLGNSVGVCAGKQMLLSIAAQEKISCFTGTAFTSP